ncbi:MAG: hypothetical protein GVY33_04495 [Alphaproteobacteria bacterium]|nr:hypothetical protein [Alphaproteobacteria bacterium]
MRLGDGPPNEALARELRQVAVAATALTTTLKQVNNELPEGFPKDSIVDLCEALEGLPDGTAEGCRTDLEFARSFLPKVRRGFFADADCVFRCFRPAVSLQSAQPLRRCRTARAGW